MSTLLEKIEASALTNRKSNLPNGWRTVFQVREEEAPTKTSDNVRGLLLKGVKAGIVETKKFYAPYTDGRVRLLNCYREIKK